MFWDQIEYVENFGSWLNGKPIVSELRPEDTFSVQSDQVQIVRSVDYVRLESNKSQHPFEGLRCLVASDENPHPFLFYPSRFKSSTFELSSDFTFVL